ncbi:MAG: DUF3592 domain-containing protein [Anaerolineales bacterium]|nr:DUF3592 domain-containing protein [Anaerolineales bacterium]MDL1909397.1 DUF3592 domain-containing protein [Chloroflexi bacterium CFX6]NUQ83099.1 DUF3592 domain-containing protein [Anaerolineales bacterium]
MNTELLLTFATIGCVFLVLNAIFLGIISFMRTRMAAVSQWHSTIGTVLNSHLERRSSDDGSTNYPVVQYSYQVGGQTYQSAKLAPGPEVGGTGAGRVVARYPVGAQVMVFYDPQNPSDAVLERKAPALGVMVFLLVVFDLALCAAVPIIWFTAAR